MSVVVDSSVWIDYLRGVDARHVIALDKAIKSRPVMIPDMALAEVLLGLKTNLVADKVETELRQFEVIDVGGREYAVKAAQNYRRLRTVGKTIRSTIDLMIGTWCIEKNIPLLHNDRDYLFMEQHLGLRNAAQELLD